jgi:hypothetical protein
MSAPVTFAPNATAFVNATVLSSPSRVDPVVVGLGIVILILLFGASFYYTVIWPRQSMIEYRHKFEMLVRTEQIHRDEKQLRVVAGGEKLYGGAKSSSADAKRIPTFREIEMTARKPEDVAKKPAGGLLVLPTVNGPDSPGQGKKVFAPDL